MQSLAGGEDQNMKKVDLASLDVNQLNHLLSNVEKELSVCRESLQSLKMVQTKFQESGDRLDKLTPEMEGGTILVPLTGSMYVPGKLTDTNNVIIDIGTGYYAQKDLASAKDYFKRKVAFVTGQMEKIQEFGQENSDIRDFIDICISHKMKQPQQ